MGVRDASTNCESEPGAGRLCREEGFEDPCPKALRYSWSCILHLHVHPVLTQSVSSTGVDSELSTLAHRFYRIQKEIQEELLDLCRINGYEQARAPQFSVYRGTRLLELTSKER